MNSTSDRNLQAYLSFLFIMLVMSLGLLVK